MWKYVIIVYKNIFGGLSVALNTGDIIDKNYKIISTLGEGAMSRVYLAEKEKTLYAIKESSTGFSSHEEEKILINSFLRESDLLYNINHPGLPKYYKNFKYNNKMYIVMEYIKGISLEDIIKASVKPPEEKRVLNWGIQLCEILFYLHTMKPESIIYRDLKPSNIIITEGDSLRLIDLGVARHYDPAKDCDTVRLGTPGYAAPEQCRKKGQSTPLSDIYALGVVIHQLLTLHDPTVTPFKFPCIRKLNNTVSEQLEWIVNKALNLDPKNRYIDTGLFRDELHDYYEENFGTFTSIYRVESLCITEKQSVKNQSFFDSVESFIDPLLNRLMDLLDYKKYRWEFFFYCMILFFSIIELIYYILTIARSNGNYGP